MLHALVTAALGHGSLVIPQTRNGASTATRTAVVRSRLNDQRSSLCGGSRRSLRTAMEGRLPTRAGFSRDGPVGPEE